MKARTTGAYALIALGAVATAVVVFSRGTALEATEQLRARRLANLNEGATRR